VNQTPVERVRKILGEHARLGTNIDELKVNSNLYQAGMSSQASVNVMLALESAFGVEFPDEMLKRSVFESVETITSAIASLGRV
jgi:acyl carrier protein